MKRLGKTGVALLALGGLALTLSGCVVFMHSPRATQVHTKRKVKVRFSCWSRAGLKKGRESWMEWTNRFSSSARAARGIDNRSSATEARDQDLFR